MPTQAEWGYLAGMIDGEGSLGLAQLRARRDHPTWFYYEPHVQIVGTNGDAIKSIAVDFGGNNGARRNRGYGGDGSKRIHRVYWQAQGKVAEVLMNTIPYLRIKREQAELLLEYCESRLNRPRHKAPLSVREAEIRGLIMEENRK